VVGGFGIRGANVGEDFGKDKGAKGFTVRGYENWKKGIQQSIPAVNLCILAFRVANLLDGIDHILIPQHNKASHDLLP
jgi:hypothetical protein